MKRLALLSAAALVLACSSLDVLGSRAVEVPSDTENMGGGTTVETSSGGMIVDTDPTGEPGPDGTGGADSTGSSGATGGSGTTDDPEPELPNLLEERQQIPRSQVNAMVNDAFTQLFFGNPVTEAVFVDQGDGTAYIKDIFNGDVRTDSMAYGMMTTVQLNQREVFDKLWAWAKNYMMPKTGSSQGLLYWRCDTRGANCQQEAATDAMSTIATTLFIADSRWSSAGTHQYFDDAIGLLEAMTETEARNGGIVDGVVNCFNLDAALPRHGSRNAGEETPVDYLMPAFYEIWAEHDTERSELWITMADNARELLQKAPHPVTGLYPEVMTYEGTPSPRDNDYLATTSRTLFNLTLDYLWTNQEQWIVDQNEQILDFFLSQGVPDYAAEYTTSGMPLTTYNTAAHRSLVALAAGTTPSSRYDIFLQVLIHEPIPNGVYRYYDGMLYMLSLMVLSGQMTPH